MAEERYSLMRILTIIATIQCEYRSSMLFFIIINCI